MLINMTTFLWLLSTYIQPFSAPLSASSSSRLLTVYRGQLFLTSFKVKHLIHHSPRVKKYGFVVHSNFHSATHGQKQTYKL